VSPDDWEALSDWLNAWIGAGAPGRELLRARLIADHPGLAAEADALIGVSARLPGFLEIPAAVLAAQDLAKTERLDPLLPEGSLLGPYRIAGLLARGGMGAVYRATDVRLHRDVALKVLAEARAADPRRVERFMREARVTAALDHPNIVRVFDVGLLEDRAYLVAELLEGETLRARIMRGPLPLADVVRIGVEVASGLVAAHAAGLVHRDLKPENIFLTRSGTTKLLDFGIAKLAQDESVRDGLSTLTGVVLGTSGYLAPEQICGETIDARADLFALGAVLFEMLTGARVFAREHIVETLHAILHDRPPDVSAESDVVPPALAAVVDRLLEKRPEARYQSAADLIAVLQRVDLQADPGRVSGRRFHRSATVDGGSITAVVPSRSITARSPTDVITAPQRVGATARLRRTAAIAVMMVLAAGVTITTWPRWPSPFVHTDATPRPPNPSVEEKLRLGWAAVRRPTPADLRIAAKYFEEAIGLDPEYAEGWAGLASAYKRMPILGAAPPKVAFEQARAAAHRALAIEPSNVEAISTLGTVAFWYEWEYDRAERLLKQALALRPGHADSHLFLAHVYSNTGRSAEALSEIRRAQAADQQWPQARALEGQFLYMARRYENAFRYLDAVLRDIDHATWTSHMFMGDSLRGLGRTAEALVAYDRAFELNSHPLVLALRGVALARMNRPREAEALLAQLPPDFHYGRAMVLHALGHDDDAVQGLHATVETRHPLATFLGVDPQWDAMRDRESFRNIAQRVNLLHVSDRFRR
jgi:serine/threonine protein kinase/tetratricopeptide (TPR) repeat protein